MVTTRNAARTLEPCLRSLRDQQPPVEVVVVDNRSTDATVEVARRLADVVLSAGPERSAQRNAGAEVASGELVAFFDADMELPASLLAEGAALLADPEVRGVIFPEVSHGDGFLATCRVLERSCYAGDDTVEAARMFRRADFLAVGGYDAELTGAEDWDLSARVLAGTTPARTASALRHDEGRLTLRSSYVKRRYYAPGYLRYAKKRSGAAVTQGNVLLRPAFVRNRRRLAADPIHTAGMALLKALDTAAVLQVAVEQRLGRRTDRSSQVYRSAPPGGAPADTPG